MTQTPKKSSGFSLLELMVTIVIVAIITTIALPSYQNSVMTSWRTSAQADLLDIAGWMERERTGYNYYPSSPPFYYSPRMGQSKHYKLDIIDYTRNTFTLTATPVAGNQQESDRCGTLTITHTGKKGAIKGTTAVTDCWP